MPRLNHYPNAGEPAVLEDAQRTPWAAFFEWVPVDGSGLRHQALRAVQLVPPGAEQLVLADNVLWDGAFWYLTYTASATTVNRLFLGEQQPTQMTFPPGQAVIATHGSNEFLYLSQAAATTFSVASFDGKFSRTLPIPAGASSPTANIVYEFNGDGTLLIVRDNSGHLIVHSTVSEKDVDLGPRPALFYLDIPLPGPSGVSNLTSCGSDGLRVVALDGSGERVIDPVCDGNLYFFDYNTAYYVAGGALRRAHLDGQSAPEPVAADVRRILGFGPKGTLVYSHDPSNLYLNGAGDGWWGGWRFMNRGIAPRFSRDAKRLRWLENAADNNAVGDLMSAPLMGTAVRLARNARHFLELGDGRVLTDENHAARGTYNRLVVIDEKANVARWVADGASDFTTIPGSSDLLVDAVSGPSGFDIVRVPLPK